ncbi:RNA methyltransferase, TrmH family [Lachnospiraceae bacterium XBB1006]|nr:RNA methyltransferase, TrmH family [Lachnospiraceae bacterium XBB1006]
MITSIENKQLKQIIQLNTKAKARKKAGLFVVEGVKMFLEAPDSWIEKVYVAEEFAATEHGKKILTDKGVNYEVVADAIFSKICDTLTPQGVLTVLHMPSYQLRDCFPKDGKQPLLLVIESLQDPGNLGTMVRTGEGAGLTGVIMNHTTVDLFNPKTIRATMGSIYRIPFVITNQLPEAIDEVKKQGVVTYAAHLKGRRDFYLEKYVGATAFLIGNEGNGLSDEVAELADTYVKIPMDGKVESLNAAIAASVMMYECKRQRMVEE